MPNGPGVSTRSRTNNTSQSTYKPYQPTAVVEPKPYEDPLRVRPRSYKYKPFKPSETKIEYKPYTSFHVFEPSNIDPLTGRPYRSRKKQEKIEEPKEEEPPVRDVENDCDWVSPYQNLAIVILTGAVLANAQLHVN